MKVVLWADNVVDSNRSGMAYYQQEVLSALDRQQDGHEYLAVFTPRRIRQQAHLGLRRLRVLPLPGLRHAYYPCWHFTQMPKLDWLVPSADVIHLLHSSVSVPTSAPTIMSVVDLASRHMPDAYPARRRLLKDRAITRAAANPNVRFVTISQFVKDDLSSTYDIAPERITAIPLGVDRGRFRSDISEEQLNTVRRHYALPDRFFLFVGMISPRKNVDVLIDGYRRSMVGRHTDIGLVLAGGPGWKCEEIVEAAKQAAGVRLIGYVNDADIPALYRLADAFVFPSSYEGFGLPVLEAMACGTPVIASGVSALPEVTGEAGIRLRAIDPDEVAAALDRLASDDILAATLRERGLHWVTHFSWDRVAVQYRSLYEACGSNIRP